MTGFRSEWLPAPGMVDLRPGMGYILADETRGGLSNSIGLPAVAAAAQAINRESTGSPYVPLLSVGRISSLRVLPIGADRDGILLPWQSGRILAWTDELGIEMGAGSSDLAPQYGHEIEVSDRVPEVTALYVGGFGGLAPPIGDVTADPSAGADGYRDVLTDAFVTIHSETGYGPVPGETYVHWASASDGAWAIVYSAAVTAWDADNGTLGISAVVQMFGDMPSGDVTMKLAQARPDAALSAAAVTVAKRWAAIAASPGRGVYQASDNMPPPTPSLLFGLTTQLRQYKPNHYGQRSG